MRGSEDIDEGWGSTRCMIVKLELKVAEGYLGDDTDRCWLGRISKKNMGSLRAKKNDVIELCGHNEKRLEGTGRTAVKCLPLLPLESDRDDIIRINGLVRINAGTEIGDTLEVRRVDNVPSALKVVLTPRLSPPIQFPHKLRYRDQYGDYYVDNLAGALIAVNNYLKISYYETKLVFWVIELDPADVAVVTKDTEFKIVPER